MTAGKLKHKSLVEQVTDALMDLIDEKGLKPGDRLPSTTSMTNEFGVSRPVIREALKILEGRGIIQISNGRSAILQPMTSDILKSFFQRAVIYGEDNLREILEIRYGIEVQCAKLAAQRRTQEQVEELNNLIKQMRKQVNNPEVYTELDLQFHLVIADATKNQLMYFLVRSIRDTLRDMIREGLGHRLTEEERLLVQSTHEDIVKQIASGEVEAAGQAMAFHFEDAIRTIFYPKNGA